MIFGKQDTHVPRVGRDLIRATLDDANVTVSVCRHVQYPEVFFERSLNLPTVPRGPGAACFHPRRIF